MSRISASLSIWSKRLDPDKISEILNFEPDRKVLRGVDRIPPRPRPTAYGWHVGCVRYDEILPQDVLKLLFQRVEPVRVGSSNLASIDPDIEVNFFLHIAPKDAEVPLFMDRSVIEFIASMAGTLDIEFFDL